MRRTQTFREWWKAPIKSRDRIAGVCVGGAGGFWIGLLGHIAIATPVGLGEAALWGVVVAVGCAIAGYVFPKPVTVVLFPFSVFGVGN